MCASQFIPWRVACQDNVMSSLQKRLYLTTVSNYLLSYNTTLTEHKIKLYSRWTRLMMTLGRRT